MDRKSPRFLLFRRRYGVQHLDREPGQPRPMSDQSTKFHHNRLISLGQKHIDKQTKKHTDG